VVSAAAHELLALGLQSFAAAAGPDGSVVVVQDAWYFLLSLQERV
jgi:hypothetical protein